MESRTALWATTSLNEPEPLPSTDNFPMDSQPSDETYHFPRRPALPRPSSQNTFTKLSPHLSLRIGKMKHSLIDEEDALPCEIDNLAALFRTEEVKMEVDDLTYDVHPKICSVSDDDSDASSFSSPFSSPKMPEFHAAVTFGDKHRFSLRKTRSWSSSRFRRNTPLESPPEIHMHEGYPLVHSTSDYTNSKPMAYTMT